MAETTNGAANGQAQQGQAQLSLQKIYVKDVSFEAPGAPQIFQTAGEPAECRAEPFAARDAARRSRVRSRAERDRDLQDRRQDRVPRRSAPGRHLRPVGLRCAGPRCRARDVLPERAVPVRAPGRFRSGAERWLPAVPAAADQFRRAVRRSAASPRGSAARAPAPTPDRSRPRR